ncbi:MAG: thiolase family protein [Hyphomicrobiales bacterium]|nr:MAG: thiolase family protein [Hyphomicrobiales bacterium]
MKSSTDVMIVEAVRTPIGRGSPVRGIYRNVSAASLLGTVYRNLTDRARMDPIGVDCVISGVAQQWGEQGSNLARLAWLREGLPADTPGVSVDVRCGGSLQAVNFGAAQIASAAHRTVIGAGVEHMGHNDFAKASEVQQRYGTPFSPELLSIHAIPNQGVAAERIGEKWGIGRGDMDEFASLSHQRAHTAAAAGLFDREIVPVVTDEGICREDQGIRADTTPERLATLKSAFSPAGPVTAGNSSQISDGAAALLLASGAAAAEIGLATRARIIDHVIVGCDPELMLEGPIPATLRILERNGMSIGDIDVFEVNEAFASVVLAWERALKPDMQSVNTRGGAIALGHPLGSTGARLLTTLLHTLEDDDKEIGLATMCCAGGIGIATLIQRL